MEDEQPDLGYLLRVADQFHDSALLHFAHASGLFELTTEPRSVADVVDRFGWVPRKAEILLDALVAIRLLAKTDDGRYRNVPVSDQYLVKSRPGYMGGVIEHQRLQWRAWSHLGEVMAATEALPWQQEKRLQGDPQANEAFHQAMRNLARANLPRFLALPQVQGRVHVIDLAGGHGTYLAAMARQNPELTGEVWDLAGAEPQALETFREYGCDGRCRFHVRDITEPASFVGARADVVMLNDCLHYFDRPTVRDLLARASELLEPAGTLLVATRVLDEGGTTPTGAVRFSLHMVVNTARGGLHVTPWIAEQMERLGLCVSRSSLDPLGRYVILVGAKRAGALPTA